MNWKRIVGFGAVSVVFVGLGLLVYEARQPPHKFDKGDKRSPLTDVARGNQQSLTGPFAPLMGGEPQGSVAQPTATPPVVIPPDEMPDPANPPRWTKPLAAPGVPVPPDPFVPPPMVVDPDRGRTGDAAP